MPDPFQLLNSGDSLGPGVGPFNAQWHNAVTEAVRATQRNATPGVTAKSIDTDKGSERWFANISEANVDQFRAVGLGELVLLPTDDDNFREQIVFYTADLTADEPFGITQEPVGPGELFICKTNTGPGGQPPSADWVRMVGEVAAYNGSTDYTVGMRASQSGSNYVCIAATTGNAPPNASYWLLEGAHQGPWMLADTYVAGDVIVVPPMGKLKVSGDSPVWVDITDAGHKYAGIVAGVLESMAAGPLLILWREGGTGEQWTVVRFDDIGNDTGIKQITAQAEYDDGDIGDGTVEAENVVFSALYLVGGSVVAPGLGYAPLTVYTDANANVLWVINAADADRAGVVSIVAQEFTGAKTFKDITRCEVGLEVQPVYLYTGDKTIYFGGNLADGVDSTIAFISGSAITGGTRPDPTFLTGGALNLYDAAYIGDLIAANFGSESDTNFGFGIYSRGHAVYDEYGMTGSTDWIRGTTNFDAIGNLFIEGICVSVGGGVSSALPGAPVLTPTAIVIGSSSGSLTSLATSRTVGGNLQIKLASDSWIEFGEASY